MIDTTAVHFAKTKSLVHLHWILDSALSGWKQNQKNIWLRRLKFYTLVNLVFFLKNNLVFLIFRRLDEFFGVTKVFAIGIRYMQQS